MYRYIALLFIHCTILLTAIAQSTAPLPYDDYMTTGSGLRNFYAVLSQKQVTVAFLGGSITNMQGWRNKVDSFLRQSYPTTQFRFINAGIPSLGSLPHVFRLQRDVLDPGKIDLLFLEAAVNDRTNGTDSAIQVRTLEGIVRHARKSNPSMDIVLMAFADPDKTADYNNHRIPAEVANHALVARHYNLPFINLAKEVHDRMAHGEFSWEKDFKDLHPSPFGQQLYFASIRALLQHCATKLAMVHALNVHPYPLPKALNKQALENGQYYDIANAQYEGNWTLNPDWTPTDSLHTRPGFVHRPILVATTPGATLILPFKGTAIGMAIVSGKDAGIVAYAIDNGPFQEIDLYTQWSKSLHLPWYILFSSDLKKGKHTLQLKIQEVKNSKSTGNACRIVYFLVNDLSHPLLRAPGLQHTMDYNHTAGYCNS
ncbi:GDSL-type esterase/lipase family protein [Paraflavitalea speifideaquila]|uniref:GDSL-type esterase/lipase family protein n=1 Tax=Paraflavitalea speifideaquila TaxID=3076558 RepID=UPI0028E52B43|nr:GDSL-type esterase/lipase family protein [Paraflavitalea speifideiaquila]